MDYGDYTYYWGLYRGYYGDPFPHSLLSTREFFAEVSKLGMKPIPGPGLAHALASENPKPSGFGAGLARGLASEMRL